MVRMLERLGSMRVALVGANGQLGSDLHQALIARQLSVTPLTHADLEIADPESIQRAIAAAHPDLVVNTAAFLRVEDCEDQFDRALRVNALGPYALAQVCRDLGATLLHVSTDYVFSGHRTTPWSEHDCPRPANAYGISKLAGEQAVQATLPAHYVARVSGLYGLRGSRSKGGSNFVETMLEQQRAGATIRVVDDQVLAPTSTSDLADKLAELIVAQPPYGLYHVTAAGACTWYEFAREIFTLEGLDADLRPQTSQEAALRARRPAYSVLANDALKAAGLGQIRPWQEGLAAYLRARVGRADEVSISTL
jgi:dTDP-4-dehydrorhamnose reductase